MSSPFPYIRLKGDRAAAALHLRRAMGELFKTERIAELSGVPVLKRTVPVDSHNSIEVQISKEQKLVYITSIPLQPGEEVEELEEKPFDVAQCPPGFIIRKLNVYERWNTDSLNQEKYKGDGSFSGYKGHILAYDGKQWRTAQYDELNLGEFEGAHECGWWWLHHQASKGLGEKYNKCDLITWAGGPGGLNATGYKVVNKSVNGEDKVASKVFFDDKFYHAGKEIDAPVNAVIGACILPSGGRDYYYVIGFNYTLDSSNSLYNVHVISSWKYFVHRRPVTLGEGEGWEQQHVFDIQEDNGPYARPKSDFVTSKPYLPWGSAHIDKEGNAWFVQQYFAENTWLNDTGEGVQGEHLVQSRALRMVKFDLRSGDWENVMDNGGVMIRDHTTFSYDSAGCDGCYHHPPGDPEATHYTYSSVLTSRMWIEGGEKTLIGMFGGADEMYTYVLEPYDWTYQRSGFDNCAVGSKYPMPGNDPGEVYYYHLKEHSARQSRSGSNNYIMNVYKGDPRKGQVVDSINLNEYSIDWNLTMDWTHAQHSERNKFPGWPPDGNADGEVVSRWVWNHNPLIKDSWDYAEAKLTYSSVAMQGTKTISLYRDNKVVFRRELTAGVGPFVRITGEHYPNMCPGYGPYTTYQNPITYGIQGYLVQPYGALSPSSPWVLETTMDDGVGITPNGKMPVFDYRGGEFILDGPHFYAAPAFSNEGGCGHTNTYATTYVDDIPEFFGESGLDRFGIAQDSFQGLLNTNRSLYRPSTWAVHRPIDGMKERPYIRMRRKVYQRQGPLNVNDNGAAFSYTYDNYNTVGNFHSVYISDNPESEIGVHSPYDQIHDSSSFGYTRDSWHWYEKPLGNAKEGYNWDEWEIDCNFMSKEAINKLIGYDEEIDKGSENMFFEIAVL